MRRRPKLVAAFAVALAALAALHMAQAPAALARGAPAKGPRLKALVIADWRGHWSPEEKAQVAAAIGSGLDAAGFDRVDDQAKPGAEPFPIDDRFASCIHREACRFEYARATGASFMFAAILVRQDRSVRAGMTLYDAPLLAEAGFAVRRARALPKLIPQIPKLVSSLLAVDRKIARGTLYIASVPPGDPVFIDGHAAGTTNLSQVLFSGLHLIRIERKGAAPHIVKLMVPPSKDIRYEARFEKTVVP